jgi:AcrR family transcriptional regulator
VETVDDARAKLLQAAGPIFADKGFRAATVRDICKAAGTNGAAVNYYFGDKERLYIETVKQATRVRAEEVPFPEHPAGTSALVRLHAFVETLLTRMLDSDPERWQARLMAREVLQPTRACHEMVEDYFRPNFEQLTEILAELLPEGTSEARLRQFGFSVVGQCFFYRFGGKIVGMLVPEAELQAHYSIRQLAEHISRFTVLGLAPGGELGASLQGNGCGSRVLGQPASAEASQGVEVWKAPSLDAS